MEFMEEGYRNVLIILDGDAYRKALLYQKKYWQFFDRLWCLFAGPNDPKDWPREYLREKLKETINGPRT
jgi:hypothetical protein